MRMAYSGLVTLLILTGCYAKSPSEETEHYLTNRVVQLNQEALQALEANDPELALTHISEAVRADPEYWLLHVNHAAIQVRLGNYDQAMKAYAKAQKLETTYCDGALAQGFISERLEKTEEAKKFYAKAAACFGAVENIELLDPRSATRLALTQYMEKGQVEGLQSINQVLKQYPNYEDAIAIKKKMRENDREFFFLYTTASIETELEK